MNLSLGATVLWLAGFLLNAALVCVLFYKRRYRTVPWFTAWIGMECVYTIALFLGLKFGSKHLYAVLYWGTDFLDVVLQIAVVLEIARYVLKRSGRWVAGARLRLSFMGATAPLVALGMAWFMNPAAESQLDGIDARLSLFTTILICLLLTAVVIASQQLGLGMRSHVLRESYGLIVWSCVAFTTDTLHAYWATANHFTFLENTRIIVFQVVSIYWCVAFWLPEPVVAKNTSSTIFRLDDLAARLDYAKKNRVPPTTGVVQK